MKTILTLALHSSLLTLAICYAWQGLYISAIATALFESSIIVIWHK